MVSHKTRGQTPERADSCGSCDQTTVSLGYFIGSSDDLPREAHTHLCTSCGTVSKTERQRVSSSSKLARAVFETGSRHSFGSGRNADEEEHNLRTLQDLPTCCRQDRLSLHSSRHRRWTNPRNRAIAGDGSHDNPNSLALPSSQVRGRCSKGETRRRHI